MMRLSSATEIFAKNLKSANIDNVLVSLRAVIDDSPFANRYKTMEQNLAAVQEAEKVILGVWAHWVSNPDADIYYKPHKKTRIYIKSIEDNLEMFLELVLKKYWSSLGSSVRRRDIRKVYFSSSIVLAEHEAIFGEFMLEKRFISGNKHRRRLVKKHTCSPTKILDFEKEI